MLDAMRTIVEGKAVLGIEFGSTRIKAVLIGETNTSIASGSYDWENSFQDNVWTYSLDDIWKGLQGSYESLLKDVQDQYGVPIKRLGAIGFSGMMHGYMAFDKEAKLLVPFRTWRNTTTREASEKLTALFNYNIPQRWSIAHLYQAVLNDEEHVKEVDYLTTLAGYIHWRLTGEKVLGIGEASGMFPIDLNNQNFNQNMVEKFDEQVACKNYSWELKKILPKVLLAGEKAGFLSEAGAKLLDVTGNLEPGTLLCAPEGDAGTGMVATNSVARRTGNISAGTSVFAMIVLEKELSRVYPEIDLVTTPSGDLTAMVHCNNCTSDLNAWVNLFGEFAGKLGSEVKTDEIFKILYECALTGDPDCGGLLAYNYFSGEHITGFEEGRPLFVRTPGSKFNLSNFMRVHLFTSLGALKIGMDILLKQEGVKIDKLLGHGGFFKTDRVGQKVMAAAMNVPVSVMSTAGEGGAWGIALLASYMVHKCDDQTLVQYLHDKVYNVQKSFQVEPDVRDVEGYEVFMERYIRGMTIERTAIADLE